MLLMASAGASAQPFEAVGTRAQGMGGAFVAVADDASGVYWNPAGLAGGAYFSLVLDRSEGEATPAGDDRGGQTSSFLLALSMPALGVSYYRLRDVTVTPRSAAGGGLVPAGLSRVSALVTHHAGATLVQSLADGLAVGATLKLVHGEAGAADTPRDEARDMLDGLEVLGGGTNRFDADVGIMAIGGMARAGLTVRNLLEPSFETLQDSELTLSRQARAGVALTLKEGIVAAADLDLTRSPGPFGDVRNFALGAEARVLPRAFARAGFRVNTAGDAGRQPAFTLGGSYAALGSLLVEAQATLGSDKALRGWGLAGRVVF